MTPGTREACQFVQCQPSGGSAAVGLVASLNKGSSILLIPQDRALVLLGRLLSTAQPFLAHGAFVRVIWAAVDPDATASCGAGLEAREPLLGPGGIRE